jgi:transcriptional regulator with GAF, ATPase, and Fis domain
MHTLLTLQQARGCTLRWSVSAFHEAEREVIINALKAASGRIAGTGGAAERLGLKRTTLQNKIRRLNVSQADWSRWAGTISPTP